MVGWNRRQFMTGAGSLLAAAAAGVAARSAPAKAQIAITFDLEMSAEYPKRGMTEWNYRKGDLDSDSKQYSTAAAQLIKQAGGKLHFFALGRTMEQDDVAWLTALAKEGHPIGNHTYDHVNLLATKPEDLQFRFQRSPWLIRGKTVPQVLEDNIATTTTALKERCGIVANGFRTPGGFNQGLTGRADLQQLLRNQGFTWVSSMYPAHMAGRVGEQPGDGVYQDIVRAARTAQPFRYPSGLIEVPMSPISDVNAFRSHRWKLEWFLKAVRLAVEDAIRTGGVFDFLAHPSCLGVEDPGLETVKLIIALVREAGAKAELVGLDTIAQRVN